MLVLARKPGQSIRIGNDITVTVVRRRLDVVTIAIDAPREIAIARDDVVARWPRTQPVAAEKRNGSEVKSLRHQDA